MTVGPLTEKMLGNQKKNILRHLNGCNDLKSLCLFAKKVGENFCEKFKKSMKEYIEENWDYKMSLLKYKIFSIEDTLPIDILQYSLSFLDAKQKFMIANVSKTFQKLTIKNIKCDKQFYLHSFAMVETPIKCQITHKKFKSDFLNLNKGISLIPLMSNLWFYDFKTIKDASEIIKLCCNHKMLSHIKNFFQ